MGQNPLLLSQEPRRALNGSEKHKYKYEEWSPRGIVWKVTLLKEEAPRNIKRARTIIFLEEKWLISK